MKIYRAVYCFILLITGCSRTSDYSDSDNNYLNDIGGILYDHQTDNREFQLCDSTKVTTSRSALTLNGSSNNVSTACLDVFEFVESFESFSGFITIRFMVNCHNEADRFRISTMDWDFSLKECPAELKNHLLEIVKSLKGWEHSSRVNPNLDVAKFINFKIINGRLENVLQ